MVNCKRSSSLSLISSSSAAIVIGGNDDLLLQILQCLPTKSLIRFQAVSKHWRSLISDSSFRKLHNLCHRHRPKPQPAFLFRSSTTSQFFYCNPTVKKLIPFHFRIPFVKILQCCNGLLLLEGKNIRNGRKDYYIYNLTTMKYRKLDVDENKTTFRGLCFVFDPSQSPHYQVFCFRETDKKVTPWHMEREWVEVFDSEIHTWIHGRRTTHSRPRTFCNGVYCNGDVYYIRLRPIPMRFIPNDDFYIVSKFPRDRYRSPGEKRTCVMESNGYLHYIIQSLMSGNNYVCVYELEFVGFSWIIRYRVDLNPISATFAGNNGKAISMLGIFRADNEEDSMLLFHVPGKIMMYRFFDQIFEVLVDFTRETYYQDGVLQFGHKDSYQFMETLAVV